MTVMRIFGTFFTLRFKFPLKVCPSSWPYGTSQQSSTLVMIHDAFQPLSYWNGFMPPPNWQDVMIDTHIYEMFSNQVQFSVWTFLISD